MQKFIFNFLEYPFRKQRVPDATSGGLDQGRRLVGQQEQEAPLRRGHHAFIDSVRPTEASQTVFLVITNVSKRTIMNPITVGKVSFRISLKK